MNIVLFYLESFVRGLIFLFISPFLFVVVVIALTLLLISPNKDK
jgi:hypothetical protein